MTKSAPTEQKVHPADKEGPAGGHVKRAIQKGGELISTSGGQHKLKRRKVFFNTVDHLLKKKADYEAKLALLQTPKMKRKRLNTLKVIMQINRALKNQDDCVKDPEELARKRHKDRLRRLSKKLEKKKMREIVQNVREDEKYGVSHTILQTRK
jgi:hypothetical protein